MRTVVASASLITILACSMTSEDILGLSTRDGRTVRTLISDEPTALLFYASSTCFGCGTPLQQWEQLARDGRLRVMVFLHGKVSEADLRNLRIQRVPAVPLSDDVRESFTLPSEFVMAHGRVLEQALGSKQILRRRLWQVVAADSGRFPPRRLP